MRKPRANWATRRAPRAGALADAVGWFRRAVSALLCSSSRPIRASARPGWRAGSSVQARRCPCIGREPGSGADGPMIAIANGAGWERAAAAVRPCQSRPAASRYLQHRILRRSGPSSGHRRRLRRHGSPATARAWPMRRNRPTGAVASVRCPRFHRPHRPNRLGKERTCETGALGGRNGSRRGRSRIGRT